jgi:hypothetical protein
MQKYDTTVLGIFSLFVSFFLSVFLSLMVLGFELRAQIFLPFMLFCRQDLTFFPGTSLNCNLLEILLPSHSWYQRCMPPHMAYLLRWDLPNLLPGMAWNCNPPFLYLPSSWDYKYEPPDQPYGLILNLPGIPSS